MKLLRLIAFVCSTLGAVGPFGCARAPVLRFASSEPAIVVKHPALYPETIEYEPKTDEFLLGSFREGAIYAVDRAGNASLLVNDEHLCSVLGIAPDAERARLWAVSSDLGASVKSSSEKTKQLAGVGLYDLTNGQPLRYFDLAPLVPGPHLLNGIAVDRAGNAYVTDSFAPVIYRVTPDGGASVFLRDERFTGPGINLNGVVVHPGGYLLVVKKSDGVLFKVPLADPTRFSSIAIPERFVGGDGLTLIGERGLVVIANRTPETASNSAYFLASDDAWTSARLVATEALGDVYPTTAVLRKDTLYVVHSNLNELIRAPLEQKSNLRVEATIRPLGQVAR